VEDPVHESGAPFHLEGDSDNLRQEPDNLVGIPGLPRRIIDDRGR
jgi:hypothetical protein